MVSPYHNLRAGVSEEGRTDHGFNREARSRGEEDAKLFVWIGKATEDVESVVSQ
jgi:hypothetical protein